MILFTSERVWQSTESQSLTSDGGVSPGYVPPYRNLGDAHIVGYFGVGVAWSVRKIDLSRSRVHPIQQSSEAIQTLLVLENLIRSRTRGHQGP